MMSPSRHDRGDDQESNLRQRMDPHDTKDQHTSLSPSRADRNVSEAPTSHSSRPRDPEPAVSGAAANADGSAEPSKPRYHVQSLTNEYVVYGVDAIWHNQYVGSKTDFIGIRKQFDCTIDEVVLLVAKHVADGLYRIIGMNATPHGLVVVCGCEKMIDDMPSDMWNDPAMK